MKYEVSDYILKPITSYELVEELCKIRKKIEDEQDKQIQLEKIKWEYEKNIPTLRSNFLSRFLEGNYLKNDILSQMNHLKIRLLGIYQAVVMLEVEDAVEFLTLFSFKILRTKVS